MLRVIKNILPPWPRKMPDQSQAKALSDMMGFNATYPHLKNQPLMEKWGSALKV